MVLKDRDFFLELVLEKIAQLFAIGFWLNAGLDLRAGYLDRFSRCANV